jgi:hypothetical protein
MNAPAIEIRRRIGSNPTLKPFNRQIRLHTIGQSDDGPTKLAERETPSRDDAPHAEALAHSKQQENR